MPGWRPSDPKWCEIATVEVETKCSHLKWCEIATVEVETKCSHLKWCEIATVELSLSLSLSLSLGPVSRPFTGRAQCHGTGSVPAGQSTFPPFHGTGSVPAGLSTFPPFHGTGSVPAGLSTFPPFPVTLNHSGPRPGHLESPWAAGRALETTLGRHPVHNMGHDQGT